MPVVWRNLTSDLTIMMAPPIPMLAGDTLVLSGFLNPEIGTEWPRSLKWLPERMLFATQTVVRAMTGRKFGPQKFFVTHVSRIHDEVDVTIKEGGRG